MSEKHPTIAQLMAAEGYHEGQLADPRVRKFVMKAYPAIAKLILKRMRKKKTVRSPNRRGRGRVQKI